MLDFKKITYSKIEAVSWPVPNYWDLIAFAVIFAAIILLTFGATQMAVPYQLGQPLPISLNPKYLPLYALHTVMRMFIGLFFALLFTFIFGTWAGKSKAAEKIIIPMIDILQSVPVLSFLSITVTGFITLFKGSMLGPECAAIFAVFVAQTWNMTLSFYQSVRTVPRELKEAGQMLHLSAWQRFWRIDVPFSMPGLLWNMMISMSGSWFFVTAAEAFSVAGQKITLPGVGSYIALAIAQANTHAIIYAILTMLAVILIYDQFLFRPLTQWVDKFKFEQTEDIKSSRAWVVSLFQRTKLISSFSSFLEQLSRLFINLPFLRQKEQQKDEVIIRNLPLKIKIRKICYFIMVTLFIGLAIFNIAHFLLNNVPWPEMHKVLLLGVFTGLRVMTLIVLCACIWVPIGVWIGFRPNLATAIQPVIQFLAAFPANLFFPVVTLLILTFHLNVEVWASPLMVLGTQWYILFNVIAGTLALPKELKQTAATFGVKGFLKWRKFVLPGIFPYLITGAITAAGGAWNASIIAEVISWGNVKLEATGLGSYISNAAAAGNFAHVALGTIIMCLFVLIINRLLWRPLYKLAAEKFTLGG